MQRQVSQTCLTPMRFGHKRVFCYENDPKPMKKTGILVSYFAERNEAQKAFGRLLRNGHRRVAWVSKSAAGKLQSRDPFRWYRLWGLAASIILFGALTEAISILLAWPAQMLGFFPGSLFPLLLGGSLGILVNIAWMGRSKFGVERALLVNHARWLVPGETVIVLQGQIETLHFPFTLLLESGEIPPTVFVLHPAPHRYSRRGLESWGDATQPGAVAGPFTAIGRSTSD